DLRAVESGHLGPAERDRDGGAGPGARRIGGDAGGAAVVAEVVEVDLAATAGLAGDGDVMLGVGAHELVGDRAGEALDLRPALPTRRERDDDVQPLAAGGF